MLAGKNILLGITGSIAAYKCAFLVRLLVKQGANVRVVMTAAAQQFITPLTLSTLSKNPVLTEYADENGNWNSHVELGLWADVMLIAPASANTLAKLAHGLCDNLLTATYLSTRCQVVVSPAMDLDMYQHPSTLNNLKKIRSFGNLVIPATNGELASGLVGEGRMAEPEDIITFLEEHVFYPHQDVLKGKKVLITAGPTVEAIDPVRYISNHSTGKMGFALAQQFIQMGAEVTLIKGPTLQQPQLSGNVTVIEVGSAAEMFDATTRAFTGKDITVMAAAVADYTPADVAERKIKKDGQNLELQLVKTRDILAELGRNKAPGQILVGFALETNDEEQHAQEKLKKKNLDLIVLNSLRDPGAGFGHDTNRVTLLNNKGEKKQFELKSKNEVALDIIKAITEQL
ncbi:bifunctional phosphopantothenoylcysteine decarboxylase/phosphopantothenate--cysteine ligase CoaBC [soil metagenome]